MSSIPRWYSKDTWPSEKDGILYRGFGRRLPKPIEKLASPVDRTPRSMSLEVQVCMDDWFEKHFGLRYRKRSLFCTGDRSAAERYCLPLGEVREIVADDDYSFCWSPLAPDLYEEWLKFDGEVHALLDSLQYRCDGLTEAIASGNEIMLVGASFLARV